MQTYVVISERNKAAVERFVELVWNRGALEFVSELIAEDYVGHAPSSAVPVRGPDGVEARVTACRLAIPDLYVKIDGLTAEADRVAISWRAGGGSDDGRRGSHVLYVGISAVRLLAGRQVEARTVWQQDVR